MAIYKPSELNHYLESLGIRPKKGLSQNFLLDKNILEKIVSLADLSSEDIILEIGPGPGALTEVLLQTGATVIAVEKDAILANGLERLTDQHKKFQVYCDDILTFPIEKELQKHLSTSRKAKVIANLPYNVTTPILTRLIPLQSLFSSIIVMVQEEVARRFVASPGTKEYGSISLFLQFYSDPQYGFKVSHNCFYPKPKVDSAVVKFDLKEPPLKEEVEDFFQMTRTAFGQRRKMLTNTLKKLYDPVIIQGALEKLGKSPKARPEELSLKEFLELFHLFQE